MILVCAELTASVHGKDFGPCRGEEASASSLPTSECRGLSVLLIFFASHSNVCNKPLVSLPVTRGGEPTCCSDMPADGPGSPTAPGLHDSLKNVPEMRHSTGSKSPHMRCDANHSMKCSALADASTKGRPGHMLTRSNVLNKTSSWLRMSPRPCPEEAGPSSMSLLMLLKEHALPALLEGCPLCCVLSLQLRALCSVSKRLLPLLEMSSPDRKGSTNFNLSKEFPAGCFSRKSARCTPVPGSPSPPEHSLFSQACGKRPPLTKSCWKRACRST
jgi:hypothetical protein